MRQSPEGLHARGLGRSLLLCVALSIGLLCASSGAAPQNSNPPQAHAREGQRYRVNAFYQLRVARSYGTAGGDESVPKTFVDLTPAELAQVVPELKHLKPAESQDMLPQILQLVGTAV